MNSANAPLSPLEEQVTDTVAYGPSVVVLVKGIAARIAAGANNAGAMVALAHELTTHAVALGQAVVSGGPVDTSFLWPGGIPIDPLTSPAVAVPAVAHQVFPQAAVLNGVTLPLQGRILDQAPSAVPMATAEPPEPAGRLETFPRPMGAPAVDRPRNLVEDPVTGETHEVRKTPSNRPPAMPPADTAAPIETHKAKRPSDRPPTLPPRRPRSMTRRTTTTAKATIVEGSCRHCGADMLWYPDDQRVSHRVPECPPYVEAMAPHTKGPPMTVAVDAEGVIVDMALFGRAAEGST